MCTESTQSLLNVHRAFWLCLKSVFAFCMVEGIMPPANLHGESTPDFIVRMYIECTFEFIEAGKCENYFQAQGIMPTHALSHDEVLKKVCGVCLRKNLKGLKNISETYLNLIIKYFHKDYDVKNGNYTTVICPGCQRALRDAKSSDEEKKVSKRKLPENRYGSMRGPRATRSSDVCQCSLCAIWRLNGEG